MSEEDSDWKRMVKAAKPAPGRSEPPAGNLESRLPVLRKAVHTMTLAWTWRKFSLLALLIAALLLLVAFLKTGHTEDRPTLIVPEPELVEP
jgi:hypothetical protein